LRVKKFAQFSAGRLKNLRSKGNEIFANNLPESEPGVTGEKLFFERKLFGV